MSDTVWRVRMNYARIRELSREAWKSRRVGVWYGAWSHEDLEEASALRDRVACLRYLNRRRGGAARHWKVTKGFLDTTLRLQSIGGHDWVMAVFDGALHLAHPKGPLLSDPGDPLNQVHPRSGETELFKFRRIGRPKRFPLADLPDVFRLLTQAGRSNVFQLPSYAAQTALLARHRSARCVVEAMQSASVPDWLGGLSDREWEAVCLGYLILAKSWIPSGLLAGRTLRGLDIVGRDDRGRRLLASCKNSSRSIRTPPEFNEAIHEAGPRDVAVLFARGGCVDLPRRATLVDGEAMAAWLGSTPEGRRVLRAFKGAAAR